METRRRCLTRAVPVSWKRDATAATAESSMRADVAQFQSCEASRAQSRQRRAPLWVQEGSTVARKASLPSHTFSSNDDRMGDGRSEQSSTQARFTNAHDSCCTRESLKESCLSHPAPALIQEHAWKHKHQTWYTARKRKRNRRIHFLLDCIDKTSHRGRICRAAMIG